MRKTILAITAALIAVGVFWGYLALTGSDPIPAGDTSNVKDLPLQPVDIMPRQIGENIVEVATQPQVAPKSQFDVISGSQCRYEVLDPQTKQLRRVLGFDKLLNAGEGTSQWQVEKPFIEFHEPSYLCRMDSDSGLFTVNATGGNAVPSDAQLEGSVVIHIQPRPGSDIGETYIYMDDLIFSSERSEFSTEGPVRMVSDKLLLEGRGMMLVFNTGTGRVDYMNIRDLDQLVLKNVADSSSAPSEAQSSETSSEAVAAASERPAAASSGPRAARTESAIRSPAAEILYRCTLEDNVLIRYGSQLVVAGADNVSVRNIPLSTPESSQPGALKRDKRRTAESPAAEQAAAPVEQTARETVSAPAHEPQVSTGVDVVITCDGGIIFQPMENVAQTKAPGALKLEMTGTPLQVEHSGSAAQTTNQTSIHCGRLEYEPQSDVLRLFTSVAQPQITLHSQPSNNRIETQGSVAWNRKSGHASITGPGQIYLPGKAAGEPSEVAFKGAMDLLFSRVQPESSDSAIERINLTGGVDAVLKEDGWYKTAAQSAQLDFGPENTLTDAFLDGGVRFESLKAENPQRASSQSAALKFGPENRIASAQMTGGVLFESRQKDAASKASAEQAVFYFDNSKIRKADLQGQVSFISDSGSLNAADATIDFTTDAAGAVRPGKLHTAGNAVLLAAVSAANEPPARFEAVKIDYDLQSRCGLAQGPVRFTFYQQAEPNSSSIEPWIPVAITADENTQFMADKTGAMEQIIFNRNVLASRVFKTLTHVQQDQFHGDKLTVYLTPGDDGRRGIGQIRMSEGNVYAESIRMQNEMKLSHIRLTCKDIQWNRLASAIVASGPGQMELDNSLADQASSPSSGARAFYQRPAFARVTGFETLKWDLASQTLVADGNSDTLQLAYVPLVNGAPDKFLYANSVRFELAFTSDANNKPLLKRAFTDQGITFRELNADQSKTLNEMIGQSLEYNPLDGGWLKIAGTPAVPCFLNKVRVPSVFVNVETGKIETSLSSVPSVYSK